MKKQAAAVILTAGLIVSGCAFLSQVFEPTDVVLAIPDTLPPVLTVLSPQAGQDTGEWLGCTGTVRDGGRPGSLVYVRLDNGIWQQAEVSGTDWSLNLQISGAGPHVIDIYAVDAKANRSAVQSCTVERKTLPSVVILSPAHGSYVQNTNILLTGTASADAPYSLTGVQVSLNGGAWTDVSGLTNWSLALSLPQGTNILLARAIADNGRTNTSTPHRIYYEKIVYVAVTGSDINSGVRTAPLHTIQKAIQTATNLGYSEIRVASGTYTPGSGLNSALPALQYSGVYLHSGGLALRGGWDGVFESREGYSVLDAQNSLYHVVYVENVNQVTLEGFIIKKGRANQFSDYQGGGIYIDRGQNHLITNCQIISNEAVYLSGMLGMGGGIYIINGFRHRIYALIADNQAYKAGGGICLDQGISNSIEGKIQGNTIPMGYGGGIHLSGAGFCRIQAEISFNDAGDGGGGICLANGGDNSLLGAVISNFSGGNGGGIHLENEHNSTVSGDIYWNDGWNGGGIYSHFSTFAIYDSSITSNLCSITGGGLFVDNIDTVYMDSYYCYISNTLVSYNTNYGLHSLHGSASSNLFVFYNITWQGNSPGDKNW